LILHYPLQVYNDTVNVIGMPGDAVWWWWHKRTE